MQQKHITWLLILSVIGVLMIGTFVLLALGVLHPTLSVLQPKTLPSATPVPIEIETVDAFASTPVPDVSPTPRPTDVYYPSNAVNLLVNGTPLMALSNREVATRMLDEYLFICANESLSETEHLIRAYIDAELSTTPVDGTVDYLTYEDAKNRLLANRTLVPVVRSVERAEFDIGSVETVETAQPLLPEGARLYRTLGNAERRFGLSETLYKNGIAVSASQTLPLTRIGSDPAPHAIENGSFVYGSVIEPTANEGPIGKDAGDLSFTAPCRGTVLSYFGMRYGSMHYGLDYALHPGDSITAPESGTVVFCGERGDYGLVIEIRHGNGFVSRLTHCANPTVELEQHVYRGDPIAVLALDENDANPHLHYELLIDGIPFNPLQYIH